MKANRDFFLCISRGLRRLYVLASCSDWSTELSTFTVFEQNNYQMISFYNSLRVTAPSPRQRKNGDSLTPIFLCFSFFHQKR